MITISKLNTTKLTKAIDAYEKEAIEAVARVVKITAKEIEAEAKRLAPVDFGNLRQAIKAEQQETVLDWKVAAYMPYSAYQEFGTGGLVDIPSEWTEIAAKFKGKGIKQINMHAQPFMYPAYLKGKATFNNDLEDELNALNKRYNG